MHEHMSVIGVINSELEMFGGSLDIVEQECYCSRIINMAINDEYSIASCIFVCTWQIFGA